MPRNAGRFVSIARGFKNETEKFPSLASAPWAQTVLQTSSCQKIFSPGNFLLTCFVTGLRYNAGLLNCILHSDLRFWLLMNNLADLPGASSGGSSTQIRLSAGREFVCPGVGGERS